MQRLNPEVLIASVMSTVQETFTAMGGDPRRLEGDLTSLCRSYGNLKPSGETYVHSNGTSELLVKVDGVIPIVFRGASYNIPINVWIPSEYPHKQPTCYVTPTSQMIIKRDHPNVNNNGLVHFPYLQDWSSHRSTLVEVCTIMVSIFSQMPPVNAKAKHDQQPRSYMQQGPGPARFQPSANTRRPSYERPSYESVARVNTNGSSGYNSGSSTSANSVHVDGVAVATGRTRSAYQDAHVTVEPTRYNSPISATIQSRSFDGLPAYSDINSSTTSTTSTTSTPSISATAASSSKYDQGGNPTRDSGSSFGGASGKSNDEMDQIMRDAITQKLTHHCATLRGNIELESSREDALEDGATQIQRGLKGLQSEKERLEKAIAMLEERDAALAEWVDAQENVLESQEDQDPDEMLRPKDTMSEQLFECAAKVAGIEDVMYHLSRALAKDAIDLHTYLKQIRNLATEQFLAKALAFKIEGLQREEERRGGRSGSNERGGLKAPSTTNAPPSYDSVWGGKT